MIRAKIDRFVDIVSQYEMPGVFNPWRERCDLDVLDSDEAPATKRERLRAHLNGDDIRLVLIGEAPGYQGCRYSGVPFCSERLLLEGVIPRVTNGMISGRITTRHIPFSEPAATVVWSALYACGLEVHTVAWNAFPWHPMKPGKPLSNRTPTPSESSRGWYILQQMIDLYPSANVVAVGRQAEKAMARLGLKPFASLRHPSMGGATEFRAGLKKLARVLSK